MPIFTSDSLLRLTTSIFTRAGASPDDARTVAEHLVEANLTGHDSHGVLRVPQYVDLIDAGKLKPAGKLQIVRETPAIAVIDGGAAFGQVVGHAAMRLAMDKARSAGVAAVSAGNCSHTGRIGTYTHMAAGEGLVGIAMVNSGGGGQAVAPFGGIGRRLSTNPLSMAAPSRGPHPLLLDIASSVAPEGKVRAIHQAGKSAPAGWIIDAAGNPTTDTAEFYHRQGALQPLGGPVAHKGFALGFLIDILAGALSSTGCCQANPREGSDGFLAIALDVRQFAPPEEFHERVESLVDHVRSSALAPGFERILVPGEKEHRERESRLREGIKIEPGTWELIAGASQRFGVPVPSGA